MDTTPGTGCRRTSRRLRRTAVTAAALAAAAACALALAGGAAAAGLPTTQLWWTPASLLDPAVAGALAATPAPAATATGDLDGDGLDDTVLVDGATGAVVVMPGSGAPGNAVELGVAAPAVVASVRVADVTGDGLADVVAALDTPPALVTLAGDGTGALGPAVVVPVSGWTTESRPTDVVVGDVDGDGSPDAVMTLRVALESLPAWLAGQLLVYHGDGSGSFTAPQSVPVCQQPQRAVPADLDGDGRLDLVAICPGSDFTALRNMGTAEDTTPPLVRRPPDGFVLQADTSAGATLPFTDALDDREGYIPASCSPLVVPPGTWDVTCAAVDASGNVVFDMFPVTVDVVRIDSAPAGEITSQTATIGWSTGFATRTSCSLDGAAYAPCSGPRTYRGLAAGPHTFCVMALQDVAPQCASWTSVGPGAPVATATGMLPVPGKPRSRIVTFTADQPGVRFTCSFDGAPFKPCSPGLTINGLALGLHTFRVQATNFAGQTSAMPDLAEFLV